MKGEKVKSRPLGAHGVLESLAQNLGERNESKPSCSRVSSRSLLTVPLVDDHELEQHDERVGKAGKVVFAVLVLDKVGAIQVQIAAVVDGGRECLRLNGLAEYLHATHGVNVVNGEQEHAVGDERGRNDGDGCYDGSKSSRSTNRNISSAQVGLFRLELS